VSVKALDEKMVEIVASQLGIDSAKVRTRACHLLEVSFVGVHAAFTATRNRVRRRFVLPEYVISIRLCASSLLG
jgi:hypothetical protein